MKLTKKNIIEMKKEGGIVVYVCDYIIERYPEYKDKKHIFTDVLDHGCVSGIVAELVYYSDTVAFYEKYKDEINTKLYDCMSDCGMYDPAELFGDKWDKEDPLCLDTYNKNLLAWFGFEETLRDIARNFECMEDLI